MNLTFVETSAFTDAVCRLLNDEEFAAFQQDLMEHPERGKVIPGCGGLRKVRVSVRRRGKGKRGGARVIYLHVPEAACILLLDIYEKVEQEDLSASEKKVLKRLAEGFKREALLSARTRKRRELK